MNPLTRRTFLKTTATAAASAALVGSLAARAHAAGSDEIKVGLIGCGGRGTGAAENCVAAAPNVTIWALGDLFKDRTAVAAKKFTVPEERCFGGLDNYEKVLASGVDMVILATPPGFRSLHFAAAVGAGKHVFTEKPVCVDPPTYKQFVAAADLATEKKLCVVAGTQRRHQNSYRECIKRIRDGAIGDIQAAQVYWIGSPAGPTEDRKPGMSDIEWQIRNWYDWTWTCGDHIVEQHIHNLDVINWAIGAVPVKAIGLGGRQARTKPGNIFDHFAIEFEYPGGIRVASYCSQYSGNVAGRVSEAVEGTKGRSNCSGSIWGEKKWNFSGPQNPDPYVQEHADLLAAIRGAAPYVNEGRQVADSSFTAVLGRMAAYTGREINWAWAVKESKLSLLPPKLDFGAFEPHSVAVPGKTELV
jgi:myo-inositol 2-dehydrogenase / D-chiro-inositol 1-dehydrogenase